MGLKLPRWVVSDTFDDRPFRADTLALVGPDRDAIDGRVDAVAVGYFVNF